MTVDKEWKEERGNKERKGAMGSKHLRLAVTLLEEAYGDPLISAEGKAQLERAFKDVSLDETEQMNARVSVMKWKTFAGGKEGILEFSLAPDVRECEGELVKLLVANGGKVKAGTEVRGPAIRRVDEAIDETWRLTGRAEGTASGSARRG